MPKQLILRNSAKCRKCGQEIESTDRHDFKFCSCGAIAVDGGHWYLKRSAKSFSDVEDTSEFADCPEDIFTALTKLPEYKWVKTFRELMKEQP